ncbi:MAG: DUF3244 domain-containing protein [Paludibacteraceae bacterium]|nr:DUF3244 domain-containing protein [Paludibacteraceae bacterium]
MKKLIIFTLCILGMCNARAEMMTAQEIILTEMATMLPWDSEDEKDEIKPIGQTEFHASIDGNQLFIGADASVHAYTEVINQRTGEVVEEEEFVGETNMYIPQSGNYELYIYSESGTVMAGEFNIE